MVLALALALVLAFALAFALALARCWCRRGRGRLASASTSTFSRTHHDNEKVHHQEGDTNGEDEVVDNGSVDQKSTDVMGGGRGARMGVSEDEGGRARVSGLGERGGIRCVGILDS